MQYQIAFNLSLIFLLLLLAAATTVVRGIRDDDRALIATRWANLLGALSYLLFIWDEIQIFSYISYLLSGMVMAAWGALPALRAGKAISKFYIVSIIIVPVLGYSLSIFVFTHWNVLHVTALASIVAASYAFYCINKYLTLKLNSYVALAVVYSLLFVVVAGRSLTLIFSDEQISSYSLIMLVGWPALCSGITIFMITSYLEEAHAEMVLLAQKDPLTHVFNRNGFAVHSETHLARARRGEEPFSLILCDLDSFKKINDSYGHGVGDKVLQALVGAIKSETRADAILARFGGDEFVTALPNTHQADAIAVTERIKTKIKDIALYTENGIEVRFTASFGVASMSVNHDINKLLVDADACLYEAKGAGPNCIKFVAEPVMPPLS